MTSELPSSDVQTALPGPTPIGPYSPGVLHGGLCWLSGQVGMHAQTGTLVPGGIAAETTQALNNIADLLRRGGMSLSDVLTVTCYLVDIDEWPAMNAAYAEAFSATVPLPARTAFAVAALPLGARVEITAVARQRH